MYTHPATHPATMITEDATHRFVTDEEKEAFGASTVFWARAGEPAPVKAVPDALFIQARSE